MAGRIVPRSGRQWLGCGAVAALLVVVPSVGVADTSDFTASSELPIRGVVKALDYASMSTELPMRVSDLRIREGQSFRRGQTLVSFDCRRQRAELRSLSAQVREAELNLASSIALDRHNAIGRNDVEIARARAERAAAERTVLEARVQDCDIVAPFDGRVVEVAVRPLEVTAPQRPFLVIIDDSTVELELIAPASVLAIVAVGDDVEFAVDELGGRRVAATLKSVGAAVDPVSKTTRLLAAIRDKPAGLVSGMSGTAILGPGRLQR